MSEEVYIKAPCCECNGRVSLPLDAVGMDFNCPHCGAGLQMLLKHVCEHCNGKLSFDNSPEAIGAEVECGHCNKLTTLSPSTFSTDSAEEESVPEPEDFEEEIAEPEPEEPEPDELDDGPDPDPDDEPPLEGPRLDPGGDAPDIFPTLAGLDDPPGDPDGGLGSTAAPLRSGCELPTIRRVGSVTSPVGECIGSMVVRRPTVPYSWRIM